MNYFPETHTNKNKIEIELDLSNYAPKSDLKNATGIDTSQFHNFLQHLGVDKLKNVPVYLIKRSS